jgi:1-acyl-sn-glycerol-3-phosphate acyltransferase
VTFLRAVAFNVAFWLVTAALAVAFLPLLPFSPRWTIAGANAWIRILLWLLRVIVGLDHRVTGAQNRPPGPVLIASKHQSAWETLAFVVILGDPVFILKKELLAIPFFGWYARRAGMIGIDRKGGAKALKRMMADARAARDAGRPIVIFPEGTRTAPGAAPRYQTGIAALYQMLDVPVVPVALNSGLFWPRRAFIKRPGTIVLEYLPPIAPGLPREAFMRRLEDSIEGASNKLASAART